MLEARISVGGHHGQALAYTNYGSPCARRSGFRKNDGELAGTVADNEVGYTELSAEDVGYVTLELIGCFASQPFPNAPELVNAQQDQTEAQGIAPGTLELFPHSPVECLQSIIRMRKRFGAFAWPCAVQ
jgi:hypothetical protein